MQCCASCGVPHDVRLYEIETDDQFERRWWCRECYFRERRLGLDIDLAPAWIERAALHRLPTKELPQSEPASPQFVSVRSTMTVGS